MHLWFSNSLSTIPHIPTQKDQLDHQEMVYIPRSGNYLMVSSWNLSSQSLLLVSKYKPTHKPPNHLKCGPFPGPNWSFHSHARVWFTSWSSSWYWYGTARLSLPRLSIMVSSLSSWSQMCNSWSLLDGRGSIDVRSVPIASSSSTNLQPPGGVTKMTVSLVVVVFELTGGLQYIVPLMIATMFSKWVCDAFGNEGIYDGHIRLNGYPFLESKEEFTHTTLGMFPASNTPRWLVNYSQLLTSWDRDLVRNRSKWWRNQEWQLKIWRRWRRQLDIMASRWLRHTKTIGWLDTCVVAILLSLSVGTTPSSDIISPVWCYTGNARQRENILSNSRVYFSLHIPPNMKDRQNDEPEPLRLFNIVDLSPISVTDHTPMDIVVEIFSKLGVRQALVNHNG